MVNFLKLIEELKQKGINKENAEANVCHNMFLMLLSQSSVRSNITIKGGVLMQIISKDIRRATLDLDFDFMKYPLSNEGIKELVNVLNDVSEIKIRIVGNIQDLKHQEYQGKRVNIEMLDSYGNIIGTKLDIGVHKNIQIEQEELCFEIGLSNKNITLFANSIEQIFVEKLKSLLKLGQLTTRFKDIYDMYYLLPKIDKEKLISLIEVFIYEDEKMFEKDMDAITNRLERVFKSGLFLSNFETSNKNWVDVQNQRVLNDILIFTKSFQN